MNRWSWSLAVVALLGGAFTFANAEYLIIIANVGASKEKPPDGKPGPGTGMIGGGVKGLGGAVGMRGAIGGPGGGAIGGPGGGAIGPPGGGMRGAIGGPGGGAIGPPGGGMRGAMGGPPGAMGFNGAMGGNFTGFGANGLPGGYPGAGGTTAGAPMYVRAVIEVDVDKLNATKIILGKEGWVRTKWGETCLTDSGPDLQAHLVRVDKISRVFDKKKHELEKDGKATADDQLKLAKWALAHGLLKQFEATMKKVEEAESQNSAVVAFRKIDASVKKEVNGRDLSGEWKRKLLDNYVVRTSEHYALMYGPKTTELEVRSRLQHLENNLKTFYYWFALQGQILPVPEQRLVAVLVPDKDEFERQQKIFETSADVADGFIAARENLAVYSQVRLDAPYLALHDRLKSMWNDFDRDQMLHGKTKVKVNGERPSDDKLTHAMTYALLEKALEEDAELAGVSHEGTRQLIAASGLTSSGVVTPTWIQFGMGSFFETPKGAPWTSIGGAHWDYHPMYKAITKDNKDFKASEALKATITDRYFRDSAKEKPKEAPKETPKGGTPVKPGTEETYTPVVKARTFSWALTYFLASKKMDGLLRYYKEISKLPRDIAFDDEILVGCFARAFELVGPDGKNLDEVKLGKFADQWHEFVRLTSAESDQLIEELKKNYEEAKQGNDGGKDPRPGPGRGPGPGLGGPGRQPGGQ